MYPNYMKQLFSLFTISFLLFAASCKMQKIVQTIADVKKLETHKDKFVGKPLKVLLEQIKPNIKSAIGDPDDISKERTKIITFFFVDKKEFLRRDGIGEKSTSISVVLEPSKNKKLPLSGSNPWTKEQVKEYGDMIVLRFWVREYTEVSLRY